MPFSFPSSPSVGQTSTQNGRTYVWSGSAWTLSAGSGTIAPADIGAATSDSPTFTGVVTVSAGSNAAPAIVSATGTADTGLYFPAADTIAIATAGAQRVRISSTGNVGVGSSPTTLARLISTLDTTPNVNGGGSVRALAEPQATATGTYNTYAGHFQAYPNIGSGVSNTGTTRGLLVESTRNAVVQTDAGTQTALRGVDILYGHSNINAALTPTTAQAMGINITPLLGPGTVTDMYDLYIGADAHGTGTATNRWSIYQASATSKNYFRSGVGIGASRTSPASALDVNGVITVAAGSSTAPAITATGDSNTGIYFAAADTVAITTGGLARLTVQSGGNIVMGQDNSATASSQFILLRTANGSGTDIAGAELRLQPGRGTGTAAGGSVRFLTTPAGGSSNATLNTAVDRMIITPDGYVGIGTLSPSVPLDVSGDSIRVRTAKTPASASAAGDAGTIAWDSNYLYVCVASGTWKRAALTTW